MDYAEIHEYTTANTTILDDDGEPRLGFYYSLVVDGIPKPLFGPFTMAVLAEEAAQKAFEQNDF